MSEHKWKVGDVAMLVTESGAEHVGMVVTTGANLGVIAPTLQACSPTHRDQREAVIYAWGPTTARPLVVVDSVDRDQMDLMADMFSAVRDPLRDVSWTLAQVFRAMANPVVKPEEPTGLGAVVEDADGTTWVRADNASGHPFVGDLPNVSQVWRHWEQIDAVKVLSDGIPADV